MFKYHNPAGYPEPFYKSMKPLYDAMFNGSLVVDYGSIITIFPGKPVDKVVLWLIKHLGARLPVGSSISATDFLYIGPIGTSTVKLKQGNYPQDVTHIAFRATSQALFLGLDVWLTEVANFRRIVSVTGETEKERWYSIYTNDKLGFSIHLSWRKNPPQDPAVAHGGAPHAPSTTEDDLNDEEGEPSLLQMIADSKDE